ncbi:choice-of-anchor L domain-containing protein [Polaribacter sp. 11A2H]|uniref:choice-of-anchor L domain-containing protein n=1 Tax=Polaribacter sp. 11A2H TaxID=2687290 RepID=UPI0014087E62|nr:choice-of-anchor L domain-containing protein [Polaribacter sp. 11A2H]
MRHLKPKTSNLNRFFKSIFFVAALLLTSSIFSQTVTVDDTKTTEQLTNLLIDNSCINLTDVAISSSKSVATFNNNSSSFPISEGIIIRTGNAKDTEGPFTNTKLSSEISTSGDADLQRISNNDGNTKNITDVAFLEFDFTPIDKEFSFNYIFASNEYGTFQCVGRDLFAIILTDLSTGKSTNIATLPDNANISVKNIKNNLYNGECNSNNEDSFGSYYDLKSLNTIINMRGFSKILNASATVVPNTKYNIKFVIGDYDNSDYDSAVFIEAGSFNNTLNLGGNKELCGGDDVIIDSGFSKTDGFNFEWTKNGTPLTDNGTKITVNTIGTYALTITSLTDPSCLLTDEIKIETIKATDPGIIKICTELTTSNISKEVDNKILNGLEAKDHTIIYYENEEDATKNQNSITDPTKYPITSNTFKLWARLSNNTKTCFDIVNFNVEVTTKASIIKLPDAYVCSEFTLPPLTNGAKYFTDFKGRGIELSPGDKITEQDLIYINIGGASSCYSETFFRVYFIDDYVRKLESELVKCEFFTIPSTPFGRFYSKKNGVGDPLKTNQKITKDTTIYLYSELNGAFCKDIEFNITILPSPPVDVLDPIITCDSVTLESLTNGNYYTGPDGTGEQLNVGDIISETQLVYIYNKDLITGCENESMLDITIIKKEDIEECESYTIPDTIGKYYTDSTKLNEIIPGTTITLTQTVFYYADEITTTPNCTGYDIEIKINQLPEVDSLSDFINCENDLPKLPKLTNGKYYTEPEGLGDELLEGDEISTSQTIYIYNKDLITNCPNETSFLVTIIPVPTIPVFFDKPVCEPYKLPALSSGGKYFTETNGKGIELKPGDLITETKDIYVYYQAPELATCDNEAIFKVTLLEIQVDVLDDIKACESFILPKLTKPGGYYKNTDKTGPLNAGDVITTDQTIYIIGNNIRFTDCQNISSFDVRIFTEPNLGTLKNIELCGSVTLPTITLPNIIVEYYRDKAKTDLIDPTEYTITESGLKDIYVHAYQEENPSCSVDDMFSITVHPLLDFNVQGGAICVDPLTNQTINPFLIESKLDASVYDIKWYLDGDQINITSVANWNATKAGTYRIEATRIDPINNNDCDYNPTEVVIVSSNPEFEINVLSDNFSNLYAIEIITITEGIGNYRYSLDGKSFQTSNIFDNIKPGNYTILVEDLTSICNDIKLEFTALNNPIYFDPNKDEWNITDLKDDPTATIDIFDRFGIFIKTIKPSGPGWKGLSSNGNRMPSTDYWYVLKYTDEDGNPAIFRSHFSLIRK